MYILNKFSHIFNKNRWEKMGSLEYGVILMIAQHFAKSEFQTFELNFELGE